MRLMLLFLGGCVLLGALGSAAGVFYALAEKPDDTPDLRTKRGAIPMAILGDSDSKSYHDTFTFRRHPEERGGEYRATTYNWVEVIGHLRSSELDLGEWALWGMRSPVATIRDYFGRPSRLPRAEEYRYNFSFEGAVCGQLHAGPRRQLPRLLDVVRREGARWNNAIVVIRLGINCFGGTSKLQQLARDPDDGQLIAVMDSCIADIRQAVTQIRGAMPGARVVLVGIFNEADWSKNLDKWQSSRQIANIQAGLDHFDDALRAMAEAPRMAFFDDRAWFRERWGARDASGRPAYKDVVFNGRFRVHNVTGDSPSAAFVEDGHAGAVWHALWAQSMIQLMNKQFGLNIPPLEEQELAVLLDPDRTFGMR